MVESNTNRFSAFKEALLEDLTSVEECEEAAEIKEIVSELEDPESNIDFVKEVLEEFCTEVVKPDLDELEGMQLVDVFSYRWNQSEKVT